MKIFTAKFTGILLILVIGVWMNALSQTVYVTNTGKKYHKSTCRYLKHSEKAISLEDAKAKGYTACKVCKPSTVVTKQSAKTKTNTTTTKESKNIKNVNATRCTATTQKGSQCKRKTKNASGKCWQHK